MLSLAHDAITNMTFPFALVLIAGILSTVALSFIRYFRVSEREQRKDNFEINRIRAIKDSRVIENRRDGRND